MGNNFNRGRKSPSFNCFNSKSATRHQMRQSLSYDSGTGINFLSKMKNSFKSGGFTHRRRVPKSNTDQNFLVIEEPQTDCNLYHIDEYDSYEKDDYIDEIERQFEQPFGKFKKSPAIYNIQSIENQDVKISDLISNSTSYSFEKDNCSDRTSLSNSSLTIYSNFSTKKQQRNKISPNFIKKLILKSLKNQNSSKLTDENCTVHAFSGIQDSQEKIKYIDDSVSCVLRQSTSSISLAYTSSMTKSHSQLESSPQNSFFSFKMLNDVNKKLNKIQHLKKKRTLKCGRDRSANERQNYLNELNQIQMDFADNISVYTLFNALNKPVPFASSENMTISASVDFLQSQDYFQKSSHSFSLLKK